MKRNIGYASFCLNEDGFTATTENDQMILSGRAARYNVLSRTYEMGGKKYAEVLNPGIFKGHLNDQVYFTYNHSRDSIMASTLNGSLTLTEDEIGLAFKAILNNTTDSRDLYERALRKDIQECSFGFYYLDEDVKVEMAQDGTVILRTINIQELFDVSAVWKAKYPNTEINVNSFEELVQKLDQKSMKNLNSQIDIYKEISDTLKTKMRIN